MEMLAGLQEERKLPRHLLAMLPCPLKVPLEEAFAQKRASGFCRSMAEEDLVFEGNANQPEFYKQVDDIGSEEELPDVVITPGISSFFHRSFRSRFLDRGVFTDAAAYEPHSRFAGIGLQDPTGRLTMLCVNPLVMVVDKTKLGDLPLPRSWSNLLEPVYHKQVVMRGQKGTFCETVLLTLQRHLGLDGLEKLGRAVRSGKHPAQMAKWAGTGNPEGAAIYIMPYFYARTIQRQERVSIIWPEEGAIASPVFLFLKQAVQASAAELAHFFTGKEAASIYERAYFPALHPDVELQLPQTHSFLWMGWDLIWQGDMQLLTEQANERFARGFHGQAAQ